MGIINSFKLILVLCICFEDSKQIQINIEISGELISKKKKKLQEPNVWLKKLN